MNNLNFLSGDLNHRYINMKAAKIKQAIIIMWLLCVFLYIAYTYLNYKFKASVGLEFKTKTPAISISEQDNNISIKKLNCLETLEHFLKDPYLSFYSKNIVINENKLDLNLELATEDDYYNILKSIEASKRYKIINLSPLNNINNKLNCKVTIEVK